MYSFPADIGRKIILGKYSWSEMETDFGAVSVKVSCSSSDVCVLLHHIVVGSWILLVYSDISSLKYI